jgi:hypothetical protein
MPERSIEDPELRALIHDNDSEMMANLTSALSSIEYSETVENSEDYKILTELTDKFGDLISDVFNPEGIEMDVPEFKKRRGELLSGALQVLAEGQYNLDEMLIEGEGVNAKFS